MLCKLKYTHIQYKIRALAVKSESVNPTTKHTYTVHGRYMHAGPQAPANIYIIDGIGAKCSEITLGQNF